MATGNVYGKTNNPVKIVNNEYTGLETDTTSTIVNNDDKTIAVEVKQELLDKIDALETQVSVYNYFSSLWDEDSYPTVFLPLQDTKYLIREICAKWVPEEGDEGFFHDYYGVTVTENNFKVAKSHLNESSIYDKEPMFDESVPFEVTLYQTGALEDITTDKFGYDNIDLINKKINRYCYAIKLSDLISAFTSQQWQWTGTGDANGRLYINHSLISQAFEIETVGWSTNKWINNPNFDGGNITCRSISGTNWGLENLKIIEGVTNKASAIAALTGETFANTYIVFKRTTPIQEDFPGVVLINELKCDGTIVQCLTQDENPDGYFAVQASYLSLQDLVYSKDQVDAKFLTIEENDKAEHIIKLGDVEARDAHTVYEVLHQHESHYPKYAYANMIAPTEVVENPVPFRGYTFFINQKTEVVTEVDGVQNVSYEYSYRVLSQNKEYILKDGSCEEVSGGASLDALKDVVIDSYNDPAVITFPENILPLSYYSSYTGYTYYFDYSDNMRVLDFEGYTVGTIEISDNQVKIFLDGQEGMEATVDDQLLSILYTGNLEADIGLNTYNLYYQSSGSVELLKEVTYSELKTLRNNSQLVPGQKYRITDYTLVTKANAASSWVSGGHQFDIIVTALSNNSFDNKASAIWHSGDTYFISCDILRWQLLYTIDNVGNVDATNGKGTIFWMRDEYNNEAPWDFKNLIWKTRYYFDKANADVFTESVTAYTFGGSSIDNSITRSNTTCVGNVIKARYDTSSNRYPQWTYISVAGSYNIIDAGCEKIYLDGSYNRVGAFCSVIRAVTGYSSFGTNVQKVEISGYYGTQNKIHIGSYCQMIVISSRDTNIRIGKNCRGVYLAGNHQNVIIGDNCSFFDSNKTQISGLTVGQNCSYVRINANYLGNLNIEPGAYAIEITGADASSYTNYITVKTGVRGDDSENLKTITIDRAATGPVVYKATSATEVII